MEFHENTPSLSLQPFPTQSPLTSICNPQGQIIAFSDGCRIANRNFELMTNGDQINLGMVHNLYCGTSTSQIGPYPVYQGFQFLPCPGNPNKYYLLEEFMDFTHFEITKLNYSLVDFTSDTLGEVVEKDQTIFEGEKLSQYVTSIQHANGRDWWSIVPNEITNKYHICLLSPHGITKVREQAIGFAPDSPLGEEGGQICFSPNGSKFIKFLPGVGIYIFDFDRCEGILSNPVFISFINQPVGQGGAAISPNSRFLYISANDRIEQYDLDAANIEASKVIVAVWDGYSGPFGTFFGQAMATPDGKIYMIAGNNHVLHVVEQPNEPGLECNASPHGFRMLSLTYILAPNIPHFRLGPLDGSICDSLGINNLPMADFRWHHADSSELLTVSFANLAWGEPTTWQWNFGDGTSSHDTSITHTFVAPGNYTVCQIVSNEYGTDTLCREVSIMLPSSAVDAPTITSYSAKILPNPTKGNCFIVTNETGSFLQQIIVYNEFGRQVFQKEWTGESTPLDLHQLSSGMYYWEVSIGGKLLERGKVVKGY